MSDLVETVRHLFTPHHSNNHRSRMLHPSPLLLIIGFLVLLQVAFRLVHEARPDILGFATNITVDQLLLFTNQEREANGKGSVSINPVLSRAAERKARDMFADGYWAHNAPDGRTPWDFIVEEGYRYSYAGENLARDFSYSKDVVDAWMQSPSHRDNLLRAEYEDIGFAVVNGKLNGHETTLVVQMFGRGRDVQPLSVGEELAVSEQLPPRIPVVEAAGDSTVRQLGGVVSSPRLDIPSLQKSTSLVLIGVFLTILAIDAYFILKRRTVRVAGHNMAHFIFLLMIAGVIMLTTSGAIL